MQLRRGKQETVNWLPRSYLRLELLSTPSEKRLYGHAFLAAVGAAAAVKANRKSLIIVGFDGSPDALAAIRSGQMAATVLQPAVALAKLAVSEMDMECSRAKQWSAMRDSATA